MLEQERLVDYADVGQACIFPWVVPREKIPLESVSYADDTEQTVVAKASDLVAKCEKTLMVYVRAFTQYALFLNPKEGKTNIVAQWADPGSDQARAAFEQVDGNRIRCKGFEIVRRTWL